MQDPFISTSGFLPLSGPFQVWAQAPAGSQAARLLQGLHEHLEAGQAITIRVARLLAWMKTQDLTSLGFGSYSALCTAHVAWGGTWLRQLVRLASSDLPLVKAAASSGLIPLTVAVLAPGQIEPQQQQTWLRAARQGLIKPKPASSPSPRILLEGEELPTIQAARDRARLCIGHQVSDAQADAYVIRCFHGRVSGDEILEQARRVPDPPVDEPPPDWGPVEDPATALVGPWKQPTSPREALDEIQHLEQIRHARIITVGQLFHRLACNKLYRQAGFTSLRQMVGARLSCSLRTLQRYRRVANDLNRHAVVVQAVQQGLDLRRARHLAELPVEHQADWLDVLKRIGGLELRRAMRLARDPAREPQLLCDYQHALALAPEVTDTVSLHAVLTDVPADRRRRVHPHLPEAARWFLETVKIQPQHGFAKVKERDRYQCQNPECNHRSLRVEAHHIIFRSQGGTDEEENGLTLCRSCHLRLIHTGKVTVSREGSLLIWTFPGRRVVVV